MKTLGFVIALSGMLVSCVSTQHARDIYTNEVATFVGKPLSEARRPFKGSVGAAVPTKRKQLENGNVAHTYNSDNVNGPCNLIVEFNPKTQLVTAARAEGPGCLTPY